ncbi:MAG: DUF302 domain-containing protein [Aquificota bacterium]|nr:DUF302 domain-containing protein [Aquificota bacterium]
MLFFILVLLNPLLGGVFDWETDAGRVESAERLIQALERRGVRVSGVFEISPGYSYLFICGDGWVSKVVEDMPQIATFYICRIYVYREDGRVRVGYVNVESLIKVFGRYLSAESREVLTDMFLKVRLAVEEVGER